MPKDADDGRAPAGVAGPTTGELAGALVDHCRKSAASLGELVEALSISMFTPPYSRLIREDVLPGVEEPLRSCLAVLAFDTELQMQGFVTLLGNSTGLILPEIVGALDTIGAHRDAETVRTVLQLLAARGMTPRTLREGAVPRELHSISTFAIDHPDQDSSIWDEVEDMSRRLGSEHGGALVEWLAKEWPTLAKPWSYGDRPT